MAKIKYQFNPHTLSFDIIRIPFYKRLAKILIHLGFYLAIFFVLGYGFSIFVDTPIEQGLKRTNSEYLLKYELTIKQLNELNIMLAQMESRDNNIYRSIFETDSIPLSIRRGGYGGAEKYASLYGNTNSAMLIKTYKMLDEISWRSYIQSRSFDEVSEMAKNKERMIECVPAIQPISVKNLVRISDFYGYRKDPMNRVRTMHHGIDFAGPIGTPVYSTGDGIVVEADYSFSGYGNQVIVDHGFGYKTRYAHLHKITVKAGDKIERAEMVGTLGSSGKSTGPHLHYEVLVRNSSVNPLNYFNDMTEEDYESMLKNYSSELMD
ncbi:MAG TPA: M23 family metallopeptidase [Tenuifilaceae bacterium]|nr:M23 family metallopeptidase [Tenuifilaceae bacterium]HPI44129.1 M23 family metallopeptidase [Tenuifilaceae bacterium]HPN21350.1 M23 family metallopeptidase [Tenuifilaceae bacterium]HPV56772.1 M23 family metallopeptidase [Tenuifilaceae bacterium]